MKNLIYDIADFDWDKDLQTFTAKSSMLYPTNHNDFNYSFPSDGKQFFIVNPKNKNSVRFRLQRETETEFLYLSETNLYCLIQKTVLT